MYGLAKSETKHFLTACGSLQPILCAGFHGKCGKKKKRKKTVSLKRYITTSILLLYYVQWWYIEMKYECTGTSSGADLFLLFFICPKNWNYVFMYALLVYHTKYFIYSQNYVVWFIVFNTFRLCILCIYIYWERI